MLKYLVLVAIILSAFMLLYGLAIPTNADVNRGIFYRNRISLIIEREIQHDDKNNIVMMRRKKNGVSIVIQNPTPNKEKIESLLRSENWSDDVNIDFVDCDMKLISKIKINKNK